MAYQANRGVTVCPPPNAADRELIASQRRQVEIYVVKRGHSGLSDDAMQPIRASLGELKSACDSSDVAAVARGDMAFHESILHACGGGELVPIWRQLCSRMLLTYTRLDDYQQVYREHVDIFEALDAKKKSAVVAALNANIK